jgi:tetrapyrrole methylase family protein/MazG family protein
MNTIRIIGLGVSGIEDLSSIAYKALMEKIPTYLRTDRHPIIKHLENNGIEYSSFDSYFEKNDEFDKVFGKIVKKVVAESKKYGTINYCIPGSSLVGDLVTKKLIEEYKDIINIVSIDSESFLSKCIKISGYSNYKSIKIIDPNEMDEFSIDTNSVNFISQIDSKALASEVKIKLMESYSGDCEVLQIDVLENLAVKMPLYSMDKKNNYGFSTYFCILPIEMCKTKVYNIEDLCRIVKLLRAPEGCKSYLHQTHDSSKGIILEEAQELVQAIENEDTDKMCEKLGDVLLQVIFHSEMASEEGYFNISDVITKLCDKLIRRQQN